MYSNNNFFKKGILQSPKTQIILPNTKAIFYCRASGTAEWKVNGSSYSTEWQRRGISVNITEDFDPNQGYPSTMLTLVIEGLTVNNFSQIECVVYDTKVYHSDPALLIIVGELPCQSEQINVCSDVGCGARV